MAKLGKAVFIFMFSSLLWNIACIRHSSHPCGDIYVESPAFKDGILIVKLNSTLKVTFGFTNSNCNFIEQICIDIWRWNQYPTGFGEYLPQCAIRTTPTTCRGSTSPSLTCGCLKKNLTYFFQTNVTSPDFTTWRLSANTNSTKIACTFKMSGGKLFIDSPTLHGGILTAEENATVNITFGYIHLNCKEINDMKIEVSSFTTGTTSMWYAPQCRIIQTTTTCTGSNTPNITCSCLNQYCTYMIGKVLHSSDFTKWKFAATYRNITEELEIRIQRERTSSILHESCSSVDMKVLFMGPDGPVEGNTFSMTASHDMTAAVQTTLTGENTENQQMRIIIYVLGAVIIIIIVMAIVISVIVRKLHMKDTLHNDVTKFESRLEMSNLRPSLKEDEFAESANSSAYSQPKSTEITEHDYTEIHFYADICPLKAIH